MTASAVTVACTHTSVHPSFITACKQLLQSATTPGCVSHLLLLQRPFGEEKGCGACARPCSSPCASSCTCCCWSCTAARQACCCPCCIRAAAAASDADHNLCVACVLWLSWPLPAAPRLCLASLQGCSTATGNNREQPRKTQGAASENSKGTRRICGVGAGALGDACMLRVEAYQRVYVCMPTAGSRAEPHNHTRVSAKASVALTIPVLHRDNQTGMAVNQGGRRDAC